MVKEKSAEVTVAIKVLLALPCASVLIRKINNEILAKLPEFFLKK